MTRGAMATLVYVFIARQKQNRFAPGRVNNLTSLKLRPTIVKELKVQTLAKLF